MTSAIARFPARVAGHERLIGTFLKTPAPELVEILKLAGVDFICIDTEHAPFGPAEADRCIAMARALDLPSIVRVPAGGPVTVQQALDSGATGIMAPHVTSADAAAALVRATQFGAGGRGYSGSTRAAGFTTDADMAGQRAKAAGVVILAQIEDPEGVAAATAIATTEGIGALFFGRADLAMTLGLERDAAELSASAQAVTAACSAAGKPLAAFAPSPAGVERLARAGHARIIIAGSDQSHVLQGARAMTGLIRQAQDAAE